MFNSSDHGPIYPALNTGIAKFRTMAKGRELAMNEKAAYGAAVLDAIRSLQRSALAREVPSGTPGCASGTWHADGKSILKAIRGKQAAEFASAVRAQAKFNRRSDEALEAEYERVMKAQRKIRWAMAA